MLRSMYSAVSGLKSHQTKMDVIGNNIANVNTVGFKSSRVVFEDIFSQTIRPESSATADGLGGTNPQQIGLGVTVGAIDVLQTPAATQYTGKNLDVSIDGDGYFVVSDGSQNFFTRAGDFTTDNENHLVNADGYLVQSGNGDTSITIPAGYSDISINKNGDIIGINDTTQEKETIGTICIANFNNPSALEKVGQNLYVSNKNTGDPVYSNPGTNGSAYIKPGSLEMSNVDLSDQFTDMIVTQRGFQANSKVITTSDEILDELINMKR
ncbi:MAG: flagellar hook-basal body complex protein [Bacillota bacterium]|nr:flagellar hook-basal body complex protein [Bacillota bacterium]